VIVGQGNPKNAGQGNPVAVCSESEQSAAVAPNQGQSEVRRSESDQPKLVLRIGQAGEHRQKSGQPEERRQGQGTRDSATLRHAKNAARASPLIVRSERTEER